MNNTTQRKSAANKRSSRPLRATRPAPDDNVQPVEPWEPPETYAGTTHPDALDVDAEAVDGPSRVDLCDQCSVACCGSYGGRRVGAALTRWWRHRADSNYTAGHGQKLSVRKFS
jgi:hypothetical protein